MVPAEDIEKVTQAVLNSQLQRSPDQIQSMINDIYNLLFNATNVQHDMKNLEPHTKTAQDLLQKAQELKSASGKINWPLALWKDWTSTKIKRLES